MPYKANSYSSNPPDRFLQQMKIVSTTGSEILAVSDVKEFTRIDTSSDDSIILRMITQSRIVAENYIGSDIVAKQRQYYQAFVKEKFTLPFAPISSISSITVEGSSATHEIKGLNNEVVYLNEMPADDVIVTYTTQGLNDYHIQQALLMMISTLYDNRTDFIKGKTVNDIPLSSKQLLNTFKNEWVKYSLLIFCFVSLINAISQSHDIEKKDSLLFGHYLPDLEVTVSNADFVKKWNF